MDGWNTIVLSWGPANFQGRTVSFRERKWAALKKLRSQPLCKMSSPHNRCDFWSRGGISSLSKFSISFAVIHSSHDKKTSSWSIFGGCLHGFHPYTVKLCIGFLNFRTSPKTHVARNIGIVNHRGAKQSMFFRGKPCGCNDGCHRQI